MSSKVELHEPPLDVVMNGQDSPRFGHADLTNCDRERIHVPGSIQPFGALIALKEPQLTIVQVSENIGTFLDVPPAELLYHTLEELLGKERSDVFRAKFFGSDSFIDINPVQLEVPGRPGGPRAFDGVLHRASGLLVLEMEPAPPRSSEEVDTFVRRSRRALRDFQEASSIPQLLQTAAERVREITGFDRVMVYRFNSDWHGEVVAEARGDVSSSFLGLHYPASDIPRQARDLYKRNWLRHIPDTAYVPARILPGESPVAGGELDLTFSVLRSVSPMHVEYLRNMGVGGSMSISLLRDGELWGLIACHHFTPRRLAYEVRTVCELLGQLLSWQLSSKMDIAHARRRMETTQLQQQLIEASTLAPSLVDGMLSAPETFLQFAQATGGAVHHNGVLRTTGEVPSDLETLGIIEWLATSRTSDVFATDCLAGSYPHAAALQHVASGLLAIALSREHRDYLLWFRPEMLRTVSWGGDPNKQVTTTEGEVRLSPRKSFEAWQEIVRLHSIKWEDSEVDAARELRIAALTLIVRRVAELNRRNKALTAEVDARDDLISIASHELRTPISALNLQVHMLLRSVPDFASPERLRPALELADRQVKRLMQLVNSLLDVARVRSGQLDINLEEGVDLALVVAEALARLRPEQERSGSRVDTTLASGVEGRWDPQRLDQVVTNLLSNALKYGAGAPIQVVVNADQATARLVMHDHGIGMNMTDQARIFQRFERAVTARDYGGLGLGLWISKQIVTQLGGEISVDSTLGRGTTFTVSLPLSGPAQ